MKKVFSSHSEVAHIWAQQTQNEGSASRMFFENGTIYSYGRHFPIATIEGDTVLFTKRNYSSSTTKHKWKAHQAVSDKTIIYCYEVPVKFWGNDKPLNMQGHNSVHEKNIAQWKDNIITLFKELGNKRTRNIQDRINGISQNIQELNTYCSYFNYKVKDKELNKLIALSQSEDFIIQARSANEKDAKKLQAKMEKAEKAFTKYINLWREFKVEDIKDLPDETKALVNFYRNNKESYTRLRYNKGAKRVETSKGVQIPAAIAKRAFIQLNGCMEGTCDSIKVPVMNYTITKTTKDAVIAGCHTIPKEDVRYIAQLLNW